jgi:glycosyltransferase involved in cell wall biosynthesis
MVIAVSMVKDEADVIETTIRRMAAHVDGMIVADNASTDGTREILDELARDLPLTVVDDRERGYYQSEKITRLARDARIHGASWVIPFDADEIWLPRDRFRIGDLLDSLPEHVLMAEALLFDHVATSLDDQAEPDPVKRIGWRRAAPTPLRKVACRTSRGLTIHQGNHSAAYAGVRHPAVITTALEIRHFPYRSVEQLVRKVRNGAAAYAASDLPESVGAHWRAYGRILTELGESGIAELFHKWYWRESPEQPLLIEGEQQSPLVFDPAP